MSHGQWHRGAVWVLVTEKYWVLAILGKGWGGKNFILLEKNKKRPEQNIPEI